MAALGEARAREMEALQSLRQANEGRLLSPVHHVEMRVCVCQKAPAAPMIQCELCRDAFHTSCVAAPSIPQGPRIWLCPNCRRSEKPPLEKILPLLASLQRIRVRLPEGDALRYMIERTVSWQHRARQLLSSGHLAALQDPVGSGLLCGRWQAAAGQVPETSKVSLGPLCWSADSSPPCPCGPGCFCCRRLLSSQGSVLLPRCLLALLPVVSLWSRFHLLIYTDGFPICVYEPRYF